MPKRANDYRTPNNEAALCVDCLAEESDHVSLTWLMRKQDVGIDSIEEFQVWTEQHEGLGTVVVMTEEGETAFYIAAPYCDNCLSESLRKYEDQKMPAGEATRSEFMERVLEASESGWLRFALTLEHLAPRGYPNLLLKKNGDMRVISLRGNTSVRMRAGSFPTGTVLFSPEVPRSVADVWLGNVDEKEVSDSVAFLYMDEKYSDRKAAPSKQVTSLTGLLVPSEAIGSFRNRFLKLLPHFGQGSDGFDREVHASDLFRDQEDRVHFEFYDGLVSLVNELNCRVYRRGVNLVGKWQPEEGDEAKLLHCCFRSMIIGVAEFEGSRQIWPVMETDHSKEQDRNFAGFSRWMEHATVYLEETGDGVEEMIDDDYMVDIERFGEVHYVTKRSLIGNAVDCLAYMLHAKWLVDQGFGVSEYKAKLAASADALNSGTVHDYIGTFRLVGEAKT